MPDRYHDILQNKTINIRFWHHLRYNFMPHTCYLTPGGGCEVLFSPCLSVCLSVCVSVCPANILVFYFSAISKYIDLKFIHDSYRVVLNALKNIDLHMLKLKVTVTVPLLFESTIISQKLSHRKISIFFHRHLLGYSIRWNNKTRASREMTSQKIRQYLTLTCKTPIPKLLFLIKSSTTISKIW